MVRLNDRPDMTLDVHGGRKTTIQQQQFALEGGWGGDEGGSYSSDQLKICSQSRIYCAHCKTQLAFNHHYTCSH